MLTRLEQMRKLKKDPEFHPSMPAVDAEHVLAYLFEVGPVMAGAMSEVPLTSGELQAWQRISGIELTSWEARTVLKLSRDYLSMSVRAQKQECEVPWKSEEREDLQLAAAGLRRSIAKMRNL
jgi:hypothetical protein